MDVIVLWFEVEVEDFPDCEVLVLVGKEDVPLPVWADEVDDVVVKLDEVVVVRVDDRAAAAAAELDREAQYDADAVRHLQALAIR